MNKKFSLNKFFSNDITLLVASVIIAFAIWFVINANAQVDGTKTIQGIPITVELSKDAVDDGLEVFGLNDQKASVDVSGNRITVGSLDADDIKVEAFQAGTIIAPGSYTLELSAKKNSVKTNYSIASSISPKDVTVFVDKNTSKEFTITDEIVYKVDEGYYANSSLAESVVTVTGPETEVLSIDKAVIQGTLEGSIKDTRSEVYDIVFLDSKGQKLAIQYSKPSVSSVQVSLTALPTMDVELVVDTLNEPSAHPNLVVSPSTIKIAAEQSELDRIVDKKVSIGSLDFATLDNSKHTLEYGIVLPSGCKNLSDTTSAQVKIDLSEYNTKEVTLTEFIAENIDLDTYSVEFNTTSLDVNVCGPSSAVSDIDPSDIICKVDFTDKLDEDFKKSANASIELPFSFEVKKRFSRCWIVGNYTATVNITKK